MRLTIIIALFVSLSACASKHKRLMNVEIGTHKRQILSRFSDPLDTYRSEGKDQWVYESVAKAKNSNETLVFMHIFSFQDGVLVNKQFKRTFTKQEILEFSKED